MRDSEAILKLQRLEKTAIKIETEAERVNELIDLTSMFSQALVCSYIDMNKAKHPRVRDLLLAA